MMEKFSIEIAKNGEIEINRCTEYIVSFDTTEPKTIFMLRDLSNQEKLELLASLMEVSADGHQEVKFRADKIRAILLRCIIGIKNFRACKTMEEAIDSLPPYAIPELLIKCLMAENVLLKH